MINDLLRIVQDLFTISVDKCEYKIILYIYSN